MEISELIEPPTKRVRLSSPSKPDAISGPAQDSTPAMACTNDVVNGSGSSDETSKEIEVGITAYVQSNFSGFKGILKKRYTDFLVNEILPNGEVLHLRHLKVTRSARGQEPEVKDQRRSQANGGPSIPVETHASRSVNDAVESALQLTEEPKQTARSMLQESQKSDGRGTEHVSIEDKALLITYFGDTAVDELVELYGKMLSSPEAKRRDLGTVKAAFTSDRTQRGQIHQDIRRIFHGKVDSSTDHDGMLVLSAALPDSRRPANQPGRNQWKQNKPTWADRGGEFLHFSLYKENKDTMEVIFFLKGQLKTNVKDFQFAGTKDRRAVTVQRVSARRIEAERLAGLNKSLRNSSVGDFEYQKHGLELGDLKGNEFVITIRDCQFGFDKNLSSAEKIQLAKETAETGLRNLREHGYFNYYGLQRFGTFATRTDTIGIKLLKGDFKGACDDILEFSATALAAAQDPSSTELIGWDDKSRAQAIHMFRTTGNVNEALDTLPRKFSAEANVIRHLGRHPTDYAGALMMIQRNLRLMYVHAYQSFVWNLAVGERWKLYGSNVVEGDLVMVNEHKDKIDNETVVEEIDADGEVVVQASFDDRAHVVDEVFERARALTAEEAASGDYSIFDVVLPQPGYDIVYPQNATDDWYKTFMASERGGGLDPYDMRRKQKDYSLSGAYRKVLARIEPDYSVQVRAYTDEDEQFVQTDLARITENGATNDTSASGEQRKAPEESDKIALVLKFQLGSSQYATMALRELSKGGIVAHKAEFSGGR